MQGLLTCKRLGGHGARCMLGNGVSLCTCSASDRNGEWCMGISHHGSTLRYQSGVWLSQLDQLDGHWFRSQSQQSGMLMALVAWTPMLDSDSNRPANKHLMSEPITFFVTPPQCRPMPRRVHCVV